MKNKRKTTIVILLLALGLLFGIKAGAEASAGYTIYVNRKTNVVNVVNSSGTVVRSMYCSTGRGYATIHGTFHTESKMRWHALYHGVFGQYCTRIHGAYLFHSVPYKRVSKSRLSIKDYNRLGTQASAGCIRLAVIDAKWIYDHCRRGTKVVIGEFRQLKQPDRKKIKLSTSSKTGWDPTDPDPDNPYHPKISYKKGASKVLGYGEEFDPLDRITVSSRLTKKKELIKCVRVSGKVNVKKPGRYKLTYTVTDPATLLSRSLKVTFTVKKQSLKEKQAEENISKSITNEEPAVPTTNNNQEETTNGTAL